MSKLIKNGDSVVSRFFPTGPFSKIYDLDYYDGSLEGFGQRQESTCISYFKIVWQDECRFYRIFEVYSIKTKMMKQLLLKHKELQYLIDWLLPEAKNLDSSVNVDEIIKTIQANECERSYMFGFAGLRESVFEFSKID